MPYDLPFANAASRLLNCLSREEGLLSAAIERHRRLLDVIRAGNLDAIQERNRELDELTSPIRTAAEERTSAHQQLANQFGIPTAKLEALSAVLPEPWGPQVRDSRARLAALAAEFVSVQHRTANLIASVRSYFQSVLSAFTEASSSTRYGRTGSRIPSLNGLAIRSRG